MIIVLLQNECNFKRTLYSCKVDINNYSIESNPKIYNPMSIHANTSNV